MTENLWIQDELNTGLQKLICLRLQGQPPEDVIEGTLLGWCEAVGTNWDADRDVPRFREAFRSLMRTCAQWPSPAEFLQALPRVETEPFRAGAPLVVDEASQRRGMQACSEILRSLGGSVSEDTP